MLRAVLDEGKKVGVNVQVHAVSSPAMNAAVEMGIPLLVHLPNKDWVSKADAEKLAAAGTKILMTIGFGAPVFDVFANDNKPRFRDGKPWPESIVDGVGGGVEAGYTMVNARTIFDAGGIIGYCTDTTYDALAGLEHELKSMNVVFSMQDMVKIMGPNTAAYLGMEDQLGTLEAGKLADIVLLDGDPLEGYWNWLKTKVDDQGRQGRRRRALRRFERRRVVALHNARGARALGSGRVRRLQLLGNTQPSDHELVDFESTNSRTTDRQPADGHGANRQRPDCECAEDQCPYCLCTDG